MCKGVEKQQISFRCEVRPQTCTKMGQNCSPDTKLDLQLNLM